MATTLNEWESYQDANGKPIVNGFVYFGIVNSDPTNPINQIDIFADRSLNTALANPQRTDAFGRTLFKVWLSGPYSKLVQDEFNVQVFSDPDAGEETSASIISLTNVQGNNNITAEAVPSITTLEDKTLFIFEAAGINTTAVTLNIDGIGAKSVLIQHDEQLSFGNFLTSQLVVVGFNQTDDIFEVVSNIANDELGIIKIWSGTLATIPNGFQICDGTNGTPDLRDKFVIGAGSAFTAGTSGGSLVTGPTTLSIAQIPAHDHSYTHVVSQSQNAQLDNDVQATAQIAAATTGSKGGGGSHTHTQDRPPWFALAFIQRV